MSGESQKIDELFEAALVISDPDERAAYLQRVCGGDERLRSELESLLTAHEKAAHFLESPPTALADGAITTGTATSMSEQPGSRIGRYKLLEKIGEGGFGDVWMAEQEEPVRRRVALKIIKLGMDTREVAARFEAERQALALMDHPHIAKVFDGGATESGRPYFVMELVGGTPITAFCEEHRLRIPERLDLFVQVCQAVQHAHQKGVIHRDLKPSNVLVSVQEDKPAPKVIDFGIAKATAQQLTEKTLFTRFHQFVGTPAYMSPEQAGANREDIDTRSDIYSLGVLLYELLTGKTPFDTKRLLEQGYEAILRMIREEEPPKPSTRLTSLAQDQLTELAIHRRIEPPKLLRLVRGEMDWMVMKCLEKDRARRYETANALALDIRRHLDHEPVVAAAPSALYRFRKFARRNQASLATAASLIALLLAGIAGSTWQAVRAVRAERAQSQLRALAEQNAFAESRQRARAEQESLRAHAALTRVEIERAESMAMANVSPGGLWFWDAATGRTISHPDSRSVRHAVFSPDGERVLTASQPPRIWNAKAGQLLVEFREHREGVNWAEFSSDEEQVVSASRDKTVRIWNSRTGQMLTRPLLHADIPSESHAVQFSPDGKRVVSAAGNAVQVWDARTGVPVTLRMEHHGRVTSVRFSLDGRWLITASLGNDSRVWDATTGHAVSEPLRHREGCYYAEFSPDGKFVVTASADGTAAIWPMPLPPPQSPAWLPELAEGLAGRKMDDAGNSVVVPVEELFHLTERFGGTSESQPTREVAARRRMEVGIAAGTDFYALWAQWFFARN